MSKKSKQEQMDRKLAYFLLVVMLPIVAAFIVQLVPQKTSQNDHRDEIYCKTLEQVQTSEELAYCQSGENYDSLGWPEDVVVDPNNSGYNSAFLWILLGNVVAITGFTYLLVGLSVYVRHTVFHTAADGSKIKKKRR